MREREMRERDFWMEERRDTLERRCEGKRTGGTIIREDLKDTIKDLREDI